MSQAYICYTGSTSMEIRIDVMNHEGELHCSAYYLMVSRDKVTGKGKPVPQLTFDGEKDPAKCRVLFQLGKLRQEARIYKSSHSLLKEPPNSEEIQVLHSFFQQEQQTPDQMKSFEPLIETRLEKCILKHPQDRNIHGKIFGGMLMRESLELAFLSSVLLDSSSNPRRHFIDDIYFLRPVDIGSFVRYVSYVTYTEGSLMNTKVTVEKMVKPEDDEDAEVRYEKATEFNLVMVNDKKLRPMLPGTYQEAMMYLEGRRRIKKLLKSE